MSDVAYLSGNGIRVRAKLITFICGAQQSGKSNLKAANDVNGSAEDAQKPLDIADALKDDAEFIQALSVVATYVFQHPFCSKAESADEPTVQLMVTVDQFRASTQIIAD